MGIHIYIYTNIYINDLFDEMFESGLGVPIGSDRKPLLMYTDDIMILGKIVSETQQRLGILSTWCLKWGMKTNLKKVEWSTAETAKCPGA